MGTLAQTKHSPVQTTFLTGNVCTLTLFVMSMSTLSWQWWHGCPNVACWASVIVAVICKQTGATCWEGYSEDAYKPNKIWWFLFFHSNWHLFLNIAAYIMTYDVCHNGLLGI